MSKATMSILGLYNYDNDIFEGLNVPEGVDKDALVFEILRQCRELEAVYTDPAFMKESITNWAAVNSLKWERMYKTAIVEYDPIENYNRIEESSELAAPDLETVSSVSAFNTEDFRDASKVKSTGTNTVTRTSHTHGNIGVTTSQQMLESERMIQDWSIYQFIVDDFKQTFCLLVY